MILLGEVIHGSFSTSSQFLTSSKPIQVAQYTPSSSAQQDADGDPSMMMLPAVRNWDSVYIFATPSFNSDVNYTHEAYISIAAGSEIGLRLNGQNVTDVEWAALNGSLDLVKAVIIGHTNIGHVLIHFQVKFWAVK